MARLTENDGREFTVTRTPDVESAGYPCLFAVTLDGHRRSGSPRAACNPSNGRSAAHCATRRRPTMRVDDIQGHHIKSRRAAGSSTAMGTPVADPGVRPAIRRLTDRYPALCLLALTLAGLGVTVRALAWILSHDGCSHPVGAVVAVLALACVLSSCYRPVWRVRVRAGADAHGLPGRMAVPGGFPARITKSWSGVVSSSSSDARPATKVSR